MDNKKFWQKVKSVLGKIKTPKVWVSIVFGVFSFIFLGLTIAFVLLDFSSTLVLTLLSLGAFAAGYFIYTIVYFYPNLKFWFKNLASKNKYTKRYVEDFRIRGLISASMSFSFNILYAIAQGILAIMSQSIWYGALAIYYIILSSIRGGILFKHFKRRKIENKHNYLLHQAKSYRNCGIYLNILTVALSAAIVQMVVFNQGYKYAGVMIYVMACYAFYKIILAVVNVFKAKKNKDLTVQSIRNLNMADALVSMFALQTAMFHAFGSDFNPFVFNAVTGGAVTLIIIAISVLMITTGNSSINKIKKEESDE